MGADLARRPYVRVATLISICFLLTSTGWLLWLYHLTGMVRAEVVDALTMGVGYLMQAGGIAVFALTGRSRSTIRTRRMTLAAIVLYAGCLAPAALSPILAPTLAFGWLANLACGYLQGYYLCCLARHVEPGRRGRVFGIAYALATLAGWGLSSVAGGTFARGAVGLAVCGVLAALALLAVHAPLVQDADDDANQPARDAAAASGTGADSTWVLACLVVTLVSLTKGIGFEFPTADLVAGVDLELSRLLYGVGLALAGWVSDRNRAYGAWCCAGALATPFFMLALSGAGASAAIMWAAGYLLFGFFALYRVIVVADLAASEHRTNLAGLGLLFGRVGDAAGTLVTLMLGGVPLTLVIVAAAVFAVSVALLFMLIQRLYTPQDTPLPTEREIFERFAVRHDLSPREREVLQQVLAGHSNGEIASALFVSEATVKYHVRNLLRKTGCKNRHELHAAYAARQGT